VSQIVILWFQINNFLNIRKNEAKFVHTYENIKYQSFKANIWFNSHNSPCVPRWCNIITVYVATKQFITHNFDKNILLFFCRIQEVYCQYPKCWLWNLNQIHMNPTRTSNYISAAAVIPSWNIKCKAVSVQVRRDPERSRSLRFSDFMTIGT
jgi:hypothetical protein